MTFAPLRHLIGQEMQFNRRTSNMTEVWIVRYDQGLFVFSSIEVVEASIKNTFDADFVVEREENSIHSVSFALSQGGNIQDRIFANMFSVYTEPTSMQRLESMNEALKTARPKRREDF